MKRFLLSVGFLLGFASFMLAQCTDDCVWPGDLNANGIANNLDVLALGLAWGSTGPPRANNSTDWEPLEAANWTGNLPILGANFKHTDANGDGELTEQDLLPININYNQTNANFTGLLGNEITGTDLFIVAEEQNVSPGGSLFFDIHLGDINNEITELYGIGFQLEMDTQYVADVLFDFSECWIGAADEILEYGKYTEEIDHASMAISRFDGIPVSGAGKIARVEIVIIDVILAMEVDSTICIPFPVQFKNVLGINASEVDQMISAAPDTATIKHESQLTSVFQLSTINSFQLDLYPNPVNNFLFIQYTSQPINRIVWYNQLGQLVFEEAKGTGQSLQSKDQLTVPDLPPGLYFLSLYSDDLKAVEKILLE